MSRFMQGVLITLAGACLWGFSGGAAQYLFEHYETSSLFLTAVRMPCAAVLYLLFVHWRTPGRVREVLHDAADLRGLAVFGVFGLFLSQVTYLLAVDYTNAGTATVLQQFCCVMVMLYTCLSTRKPPRVGEVAALACALAATFLIATGGDVGHLSFPLAGIVWGLLSAATVAFYLVQPLGLMDKWGSMLATGMGMAFGGLVGTPLFLVLHAVAPAVGIPASWVCVPALDGFGWAMLAVFVVVGTFLAYALFLNGVSKVGGVVGGLLGCAEPVSASLFSMLWLGTVYTAADWAGLVLMLLCVAFVSVRPKSPGGADANGTSAAG